VNNLTKLFQEACREAAGVITLV